MTDVFGVTLPTVGGSRDTWATSLNNILIAADADVTAVEASVAALSPSYVLISTQTASASSTLAFTGLSSTYTAYVVEFSGVYMSTTGTGLGLRTSTNGGSNYGSTSAYLQMGSNVNTNSAVSDSGGTSDYIFIVGNDSVSDTAAESMSGRFTVRNHASGTAKTQVIGECLYSMTGDYLNHRRFGGQSVTAQDTDAIQILPTNGGTITAGVFKLYGVKA